MRVFISPRPQEANDGLRRVVEALHRYLPEFGVELVDTPDDADLIHCHAGALHDRPGKPLVNSSHGLYWAEYPWDEWADEANAGLALALEVANAHTAPSEWVAAALRRGMLINPKVVSHGVEPDEWLPGDGNGGYVLWNKGRADPVSDPTPVGVLADLLPNVPFTSTLAPPEVETPNLTVTGRLSPASMRALVRHAGVYLATARETFGIGTLEALSSGVPVAGWDYGRARALALAGQSGRVRRPIRADAVRLHPAPAAGQCHRATLQPARLRGRGGAVGQGADARRLRVPSSRRLLDGLQRIQRRAGRLPR